MTDPAQNLDDAQARLQAAAESEPAKRKQNPVYDVLREVDDGEGYMFMGRQVPASSRKEAIKLATADGPEGERSGTFLVIPSKEIKTITRATRTETVDEWD